MAGYIIKHLSTGFYICEVVLKRDGMAASIDMIADLAKAQVFVDKKEAARIAAKWLGAHDSELVKVDGLESDRN